MLGNLFEEAAGVIESAHPVTGHGDHPDLLIPLRFQIFSAQYQEFSHSFIVNSC